MTASVLLAVGCTGLGPQDALAALAQSMLALRSAGDLSTACAIAGSCAMQGTGANDWRILRVDPRSGTLRCMDPAGIETPYLAEPEGPVEWTLQQEMAAFDDGLGAAVPGGASPRRECELWTEEPGALATLPLLSNGTVCGVLLVAFPSPHGFTTTERLMLQTLGDGLAVALERADLRRQLDDLRRDNSRLERRIAEGDETASNLMSVVAHEIRSPLTAIKAYAEALLESLRNAQAPRERFLSIINVECDRLSRLVTDILDLSRLESGQRPLRLTRIELETLVREMLEGLQPVLQARRIRTAIQIEPKLLLEADVDLLRRLLINLLGNAAKYSPIGGEVRVTGHARGDEFWVSVEDQGPGIPAEDLPHVFERFYRARQQGDQETEGNGLGLAIARGIVELHGGRIQVEVPGKGGTRFVFCLPQRQLASARARRIARSIVTRGDLPELFEQTVEMVAAAMDAEIVSLMLIDPEAGDLSISASRGLEGQQLEGRRTTMRSGVAGSVAAWGRPLLVNNIETDRRFRRMNHPQYKTKSLLCVPLKVEGEVVGVLNVNNKRSGEPFDDDDLAVLGALVERVGSAIERASQHPDSPKLVAEAIQAVRSITQLKRGSLLGGRQVVHLSRALARELEMPDSEVDLIGYVASIHDIGMGSVNDQVAHGETLDDRERSEVERHPEVSVEIMRPLEYQNAVRDVILAHHEHWDGSGYPRALSGIAIPAGARVLAVVDAWESMTRGRPFRAPIPREAAMDELRRAAGGQFDPQVVAAFLSVLGHEEGTS
ncbi:MAG: HD domain-containing phosphohydrolase [Candidatus Eisenbacteria bacterium]